MPKKCKSISSKSNFSNEKFYSAFRLHDSHPKISLVSFERKKNFIFPLAKFDFKGKTKKKCYSFQSVLKTLFLAGIVNNVVVFECCCYCCFECGSVKKMPKCCVNVYFLLPNQLKNT